MKRSSNLYKDMCDLDNIRKTYNTVKKSCTNKRLVYDFNLNESANLYNLMVKLTNKSYEFHKYHIFMIHEKKYRIIMSESIEDKIVNHLLCDYVLIPSLMKGMIDTSVATRKNKGTSYAFFKINEYIHDLSFNGEVYALKIDISKYFYNIDHELLINKIKNKIKDKDALNLIIKLINTTDEEYINEDIINLKHQNINSFNKEEINKIPLYEKGKGLGIGSMVSQVLAAYYLNDVDYFIKENLKCKSYIRFMDDLLILDNNLNRLKEIYYLVENEIINNKLKINDKHGIYKLSRGLNFLGFTFINKDKYIIKINKQSLKRIKSNLKSLKENNPDKLERSLASYHGLFLMVHNYKYYLV